VHTVIISVDSSNLQDLFMTQGAALVAFLTHTNAYIKQLKILIDISNRFAETLTIFIISTEPLENLKAGSANAVDVFGTPTFLLLLDGKEQARFLGEADSEKLKEFLQKNQTFANDTRNISQSSKAAING